MLRFVTQMRLLSAEELLSGFVFLLGGLSIASALTPVLIGRRQILEALLPDGVPRVARIVAISFGLMLVWLSRALARRRRRAWQVAVVLAALLALSHLLKGLDFEEASLALVILAYLIHYRERFEIPSEPVRFRPLLGVIAVAVASATLSALFTVRLHGVPARLVDGLIALGITSAFYALYLWLRPLEESVHSEVASRGLARTLIRAYGRDSLAYFTLRRDKNLFFSSSRRSFLAYRVIEGTALISGDPVGSEIREVLRDFQAEAHSKGWRVAILAAGAENLSIYRELGLRSIKIGDEAIIQTGTFSICFPCREKVRQSVTRLEREGYRAEVLREREINPELRGELERVSKEWLGSQPERGFSMAFDEIFADPEMVFVVARHESGRVGGFLQFTPVSAGELSLGAMRRRRDTPNGLMEYLVVETVRWAREHDTREVSLNFCVAADLLRAGKDAPVLDRILRFVLLRLDRFFQIDRLYSFNKKFQPLWRPRYICFETVPDLPLVGLAYLYAESLLTPPRLWVKARKAARRYP